MAEHVFSTASSETLYTGKIFALRSDRVRMPGDTTAVREVVEHYGAVAVAALDADNNIPLVYQYRHAFGRRLPRDVEQAGGQLPKPPQQTAARELHEEVGLRADTWRVLVDLNSAPGFSDESVRIYLATGLTEVGRPEAHHEEADMTMSWVPVAEAARRVLRGDIVNSIAIAGILAAHAVTEGFAQPRPVDSPWIDRPTAFAARKAGP